MRTRQRKGDCLVCRASRAGSERPAHSRLRQSGTGTQLRVRLWSVLGLGPKPRASPAAPAPPPPPAPPAPPVVLAPRLPHHCRPLRSHDDSLVQLVGFVAARAADDLPPRLRVPALGPRGTQAPSRPRTQAALGRGWLPPSPSHPGLQRPGSPQLCLRNHLSQRSSPHITLLLLLGPHRRQPPGKPPSPPFSASGQE